MSLVVLHAGVPRLSRHRMGLPGQRRSSPLREAEPGGFQSGLSWRTILAKREDFRAAFHGFEFDRIARFTQRDLERLLKDEGIVRHRGKIEAVIHNARPAQEIIKQAAR